MEDPQYPWMRQDGETNPSYEAFRAYMRLRSTTKVAEELEKSITLVTGWCTRHRWVERMAAYDSHIARAETDDYAGELAKVRTRHVELTDKLLDHLDRRLDAMISMDVDPTVRWTQAFIAATKAQIQAVTLREQNREHSLLDTVLRKLEQVEEMAER